MEKLTRGVKRAFQGRKATDGDDRRPLVPPSSPRSFSHQGDDTQPKSLTDKVRELAMRHNKPIFGLTPTSTKQSAYQKLEEPPNTKLHPESSTRIPSARFNPETSAPQQVNQPYNGDPSTFQHMDMNALYTQMDTPGISDVQKQLLNAELQRRGKS